MNAPTNESMSVYDAILAGISFKDFKDLKLNKNKIIEKSYWQAVKNCVESEQSDNPNQIPKICSIPRIKSKTT